MNEDIRKRGLLERWTRLEGARLRTPCTSEVVSIIAEQVRIQEELHDLGEDVHPAKAARV